MRSTLAVILFACFSLLSWSFAHAQSGAKRPIRLLVGSPPGGPSDTQARLVVPRMSEILGHSIIVDNRPSNNGVVANEIAARAAPDGYTLIVGNSGTHAVNQTLYKSLPYDCIKDFAPITQFSTTGLVLAANPRLPANTIPELAAYAKKEPGKINIGIPGATGQLAGDALWSMLGVKMNNINYKGSSPSEIALLSGEVDIVVLTPLAAMNHLSTGKLKALGMTSAERHPALPNVPTVAEQGVTGYDFQFWNGMFAPARTPPALVRKLNEAVVAALNSAEVTERLMQMGLVKSANSPEAFAAIVKNDVERFRKVIIESGIPRM
ncbi:MAG: Bug family tripartite tricarboxylate transporter substrate binding protein [Rhodospirillaceae bacterium]